MKNLYSLSYKIKLVLILIFFLSANVCVGNEYIVFNKLFKGSGSSYTLNSNSISTISAVTGVGFRFTSQSSTFATSLDGGNNVQGTITYLNNGVVTSISGTISRLFKTGNTKDGFYFYVNSTTAYLIIIPGRESEFSSGNSYNSDGSFDYNDVFSVKNTQYAASNVRVDLPNATDVNENANDLNAYFTLSFSANRTSSNGGVSFTPSIVNGTTSSSDLSSTIYYRKNSSDSWSTIPAGGISVLYSENTIYFKVAITSDNVPECTENFNLETGAFTGSGASQINNNYGVFGSGNIIDDNDPLIWNGSSSTNWDLAANWTPNLSPGSCYYVQIPASLSNYPDFTSSSTNTTIAGLNIASGGKLKLTSGTLSVKGPVVNNDNTNGVYSDGTLELNGTSAQTISGTGLFHDVKINNAAGVSLSSGSTIITGILTPAAGEITTNGRLVFRQNATDHGEVGQITGCPRTVFTGNVTIERYIPASNRSFRFLTPGVTTSTSIKQNWQENSNVTNPNAYPNTTAGSNNPNLGYGTHITGSTTGLNGFDATLTGNPSLFSFNQGTQLWTSISNTNTQTLSIGEAYRILIRGSRATDLTSNTPSIDATTIRTVGALTTCDYVFNTGSVVPLSSTTGNYSFIGNPYWSVVDWNSLTISGVEDNIYYWDPTVSGSNNRGAYVTYNRTNGNQNNASRVDRYIQPGQAFFVKTTNSTPSITFGESKKSNGNKKNIFEINKDIKAPLEGSELNITNAASPKIEKLYISLRIKDFPNNINSDGCLLSYSDNFSDSYGREDASKLQNLDENIALFSDGVNYAIMGKKSIQQDATDTATISLWNLNEKPYVIKIDPSSFDKTKNLYFINKKNNTSLLLKPDEPFEYEFQPLPGQKSSADFAIAVGGSRAATEGFAKANKLIVYPNPTSNELHYVLPAGEKATSIRIYNETGQTVILESGNAVSNTIKLLLLRKGKYWLEVKTLTNKMITSFHKQ